MAQSTAGPYRFVRHPSYTGALMLGLASGNQYRDYMQRTKRLIPAVY